MLPDKESCGENTYTVKNQYWTYSPGNVPQKEVNFFLHLGAMLVDLLIAFLISCIVCGFLLFTFPLMMGCSIAFALLICPWIVFAFHKVSLCSIGEYLFCIKAEKERLSVWKMFYAGNGYLQVKINLIKLLIGTILLLAEIVLCFA